MKKKYIILALAVLLGGASIANAQFRTQPIHGGSGSGGGGGGTFSTSTAFGTVLNNYATNNTDVVEFGGSSTSTASFWFDPNIKSAVIGGPHAPIQSTQQLRYDPLLVYSNTNDLVSLDILNNSTGNTAGSCVTFENNATTYSFPGTNYGDICQFGGNYDGSLGNAAKANDLGIWSGSNNLVLGAVGPGNAVKIFTGPNSFSSGTQDATFLDVGGITNFGIGSTSPSTRLSVSGDGYIDGKLRVSSIVATGTNPLTLSAITGTQCLHAISGVVSGTGSDCGAGGGGGATIAAGTNITISEGSPCSSGTCTINGSAGTGNFLTNISSNTFLNIGTTLQAPVLNATSTTGTSTIQSALEMATSTSNSMLEVNGSIHCELAPPLATSTSMTIDMSAKNQCNHMVMGVGSSNTTVTIVNGNKVPGKTIILDVVSPPGSANIGTTTLASGTNSGPLLWDGGVNPGSSVINGLTDRFACTSTASTTGNGVYLPYLACDLTGSF